MKREKVNLRGFSGNAYLPKWKQSEITKKLSPWYAHFIGKRPMSEHLQSVKYYLWILTDQ